MEKQFDVILQEIEELWRKDVFQFVLVHFWRLLISFLIILPTAIVSGESFKSLILGWYIIVVLVYAPWIFYVIFFKYDRMVNRFNHEIQRIKIKRFNIEKQFSELSWYIGHDIDETGINNFIVLKIKTSIDSINEYIIDYAISVKRLGISKEFSWLLVNSKKFLNLQSKFITSILQEMNTWQQNLVQLIQSWISHHATELAELEKQIQSQESATENEGGKAALELSRISLQEHLKELQKMRI